MENQHRKIAGYRELSQAEIDLMNEIKAMGPQLEALLGKIDGHLFAQNAEARRRSVSSITDERPYGEEELVRLKAASPSRWLAIARTDLQTGLMALTRAVAQPTFF